MTVAEGNIHTHIWADMKQWFGKSLRVILPMGCSIALLCWLFHKVNVNEMLDVIRHNVDYWWFGLLIVFNTLSYMIRGTRWGLQLAGVGIHVKRTSLWVSIFGAYALNLLFTGFGETWRCLFISHHKKAPLSTVIGTDIGDRMTDLVAVLLIMVLTFVCADSAISDFIQRYTIGRDAAKFFTDPAVWATATAIVMVSWGFGHFFRRYKLVGEIDRWFGNVWSGLKVIITMPHKGKFLVLTVGIWVCYFMQTYICFYAFPFTRALITPELYYGLLPGLVCLFFGSISMAIPSSGGLGPWNLAIIFSLTLYGVGQTQATAFAMLAWGTEAILQVVLGIISAIYVSRLPDIDTTAPSTATSST